VASRTPGFPPVPPGLRGAARQRTLGRLSSRVAGATEPLSGKHTARPQFKAMMGHVRSGDQLHVHSMDRLSRNMIGLIGTVTALIDRGITIHFHKEGLKFEPSAEGDSEAARAMKRLQLSIMGAVAEFERSMIRERQR
jgi:DNA invertase Pin-like site-specific DNA recombinase